MGMESLSAQEKSTISTASALRDVAREEPDAPPSRRDCTARRLVGEVRGVVLRVRT